MNRDVMTEQKAQWQQSGCWLYLRGKVVDAYLWQDRDGKWISDTSPVVGRWDRVEDAKAAVVSAYRKQALDLLAALPD
jgi:hypothetical protein